MFGARPDALDLLETAVELDPSFAEAHARLALLYARSLVDWFSDPAAPAYHRGASGPLTSPLTSAGMSKLLLSLRDVPDDEADDVRRFLESAAIGYYETLPNRWGIAGAIWIRDDGDVAAAKRLMAEYQRERQARAREGRVEAERNGTAQTFADVLRTQPLRVMLTVIGIALVLGLMAVPVLLLWQ